MTSPVDGFCLVIMPDRKFGFKYDTPGTILAEIQMSNLFPDLSEGRREYSLLVKFSMAPLVPPRSYVEEPDFVVSFIFIGNK